MWRLRKSPTHENTWDLLTIKASVKRDFGISEKTGDFCTDKKFEVKFLWESGTNPERPRSKEAHHQFC